MTDQRGTHQLHCASSSRLSNEDAGKSLYRGSGSGSKRNTRGLSSFNPPRVQIPRGWTLVPLPTPSNPNNVKPVRSSNESLGSDSSNRRVASDNVQVQCEPDDTDDGKNTVDVQINETSLTTESLKKRERRKNRRISDEEAQKRVSEGLKPYIVQVKPSGIIDSGCNGHLRWQEHIRDITPRMLDMSVIVYEDQDETSRKLLRDALFNKFEFVDNEVTPASFDRMIKNWLRKDRERVKRIYGHSTKPPPRFTDKQWEAMRKYWDLPGTKERSQNMSGRRSKVACNPRVGRRGYQGNKAKLVRINESENFVLK